MTATDELGKFEHLVKTQAFGEATALLRTILQGTRRGAVFAPEQDSDDAWTCVYTRLATAITALLANPVFRIGRQDFELMALEHAAMTTIFATSVFGNTDHIVRSLGIRAPKNSPSVSFADLHSIAKLLLCYPLDSAIDIDFEEIARTAPQVALPAFLGMLANSVVMSDAAHRRREKLLTLGPLLERAELEPQMLLALSAAYMMASYGTSDSKHDIKRSFNVLVRQLIERQVQLPQWPLTRELKSRPTILVAVEWFNSAHAMYRVFGASIRQLKERFRLVMMGHEMCMDEVAKSLFDEIITLPNAHLPMGDVIAKVSKVAPDVILYPSVGMMMECVALSAVRLAPIQVTMVGHPATTNSDVIDYMLVDGLWPGTPDKFSETLIVQQPGSTVFTTYPNADFPAPQIRDAPDPVRIAIPSSMLKLNAPFLATCQAIKRRARRNVEFHFFPSATGLILRHIRREIQRWIPEAQVHEQCEYNRYLRILGECDLHLSTFPFGGGNSNLDSMRLGIPLISLQGDEIHGQIDAAMIRRAKMPTWLIARDRMQYEAAALRLIENDEERLSIARQIANTDVIKLFTESSSEASSGDVLRALTFLYGHHELIQASGKRHWTPAERGAL
jgi:hypothetical protein